MMMNIMDTLNSSTAAQQSGKPLWSSEDYSTYSDYIGGGCWARILNQNYVMYHTCIHIIKLVIGLRSNH